MDPLIIVPARAASRGILHKNTRPLAGLSPLERALRVAHTVPGAHVVVTSDFPLTGYPSVTHHRRPPHLATDFTPMADVVTDVLHAYAGPETQPVLLLQPTQPLRTPFHVHRALNLLHVYPRVASVVEVEPAQKLYFREFRSVTRNPQERRQDCECTYRCDGTVYGVRRRVFLEHPVFVTGDTKMFLIDPAESCPLDTPLDWELAELRLRHHDADRRIPPDTE